MVSPLDLPSNPTPEQLDVLKKYLELQGKNKEKKKETYIDRFELISKKLIIFKHSQRKSNIWHMRMYLQGQRKYKILSLGTDDIEVAKEKSLEKWRTLQNQIESGGTVFEPTTVEALSDYHQYLDQLLSTDQLRKHTVQTKKTCLKKLAIFLEPYAKPSDAPENFLRDYVIWRRTKNWDKKYHKNNPEPPTDQTINTELSAFRGFFEWCKEKKIYVQDIKYPYLDIDASKNILKNPSWSDEDWMAMVYYLRTWEKKDININGNLRKGKFYKQVFSCFMKVLVNSGLRTHEALLLKWDDVLLKSRTRTVKSGKDQGKKKRDVIAEIQVNPKTKSGRRLVICNAGIYFEQLYKLYKGQLGRSPLGSEYVFQNVGTASGKDAFIGKPLNDTFFRRLWYECRDSFEQEKYPLTNRYTFHSCRAYFINTLLECGKPPAVVADLVGHSLKTMELHYKNIKLRGMTNELVDIRKKKLREMDFLAFELDEVSDL